MFHAVLRTVVSAASVLVFVALCGIAVFVHRRLARSAGLRRWPTLAAGIALAAGVAVTATPQTGPDWNQFAQFGFACAPGWPDPLDLLKVPSQNESTLNMLVFLPFGICAGSAARNRRHVGAMVLVTLSMPALVEASQGIALFTRNCSTQDWLNNAAGGLLGLFGTFVISRTNTVLSRRRQSTKQAHG